jgi:hypothetical protein
MPLYSWKCKGCGFIGRKLSPKRPGLTPCTACGGDNEYMDSSPTSRVIEVMDNGVMTRKVEVLSNISDLMKNRSKPPGEPDII